LIRTSARASRTGSWSWGDDIGLSLFPIGLIEDGRYFLGIDEYSEIYLVETWVATFGRMPEGLEGLVMGSRPVAVRG